MSAAEKVSSALEPFRERTLGSFVVGLCAVGHDWALMHFHGERRMEAYERLTRFFLQPHRRIQNALVFLRVIVGGERPELPPRGAAMVLGAEDWVVACDPETHEAFCWIRSLDGIENAWGPETPLHVAIGWMAERQGYALAHAAAFGRDQQAVLVVGPPGVGKSTLAVRAAMRGYDYYGDDRVIISHDGSELFSLFSSAKCFVKDLTPEHERFDTGLRMRDKAILSITAERGAARICAVVVPVRRPEHDPVLHGTLLWNTTPAHALRALAPSSRLQLPGLTQRSLDVFSKVVLAATPLALSWGSDVDLALDRIEQICGWSPR